MLYAGNQKQVLPKENIVTCRPPIVEAAQGLSNVISYLKELVDVLEMRLGPVLIHERGSAVNKNPNCSEPSPPASVLTSGLRVEIDRIADVNSRVLCIIDRLDLPSPETEVLR